MRWRVLPRSAAAPFSVIIFRPRLGWRSLTLALCGHRHSLGSLMITGLLTCTSWGPGEDQKRFLMLPCFSTSSIWISRRSHTLRQPLSVIHDSKDSVASWVSNLEVKKKSPLIGAGELKVKREAYPFMSPRYKVFMFSPRAYSSEQSSSGGDVSFL